MYLYERNTPAPMRLGEPPQPQVQFRPPAFPFRNIEQKMPQLLGQALAAKTAVDKLSWFKESYLLLMNAAANAHLALNKADQVVVVPDEKSTADLLGPKLVQAVLKSTGKATLKHVLGEEFGTVLGVLDILSKVIAALSMADARDLVNNQRGSRFKDARAHKLRFFIALYIGRFGPQSNPGKVAYQFYDWCNEYEKRLGKLWEFETIEKNLAAGLPPNQPEPARMYPR